MWDEPGAHWKTRGAVYAVPSTLMDSPGGLVVIVIGCGVLVKLALTLRGALMVSDTGFTEPAASPDQEENCCPDEGVAVN